MSFAPGPLPAIKREAAGAGLTTCDINADGHQDLFVVTATGNLVMLGADSSKGLDGFTLDKDHPLAKISAVTATLWGDYDTDGDADIYVANDSTRSFLYTNQGDGTFGGDSFLAGVGYSEDGRTQAGMGTDFGDFDADGDLDLIVTNLTLETNTLYRNLGDAAFVDDSYASGIGEPSLLLVGFGTNWFDVDADGDLDLFVANGHIIDNIAEFREGVAGSARADTRSLATMWCAPKKRHHSATDSPTGPAPAMTTALAASSSAIASSCP